MGSQATSTRQAQIIWRSSDKGTIGGGRLQARRGFIGARRGHARPRKTKL